MTGSSALVPLSILAVAAPLGAFDVLYYHLWKYRLASRAESRFETLTHLARGVIIGAFALILAHWEPHGAWFWFVAAAMVLDFVNNVLDVAVEPRSRAALGGLPRNEYVVHIVGATAGGAVTAVFLALGVGLGQLPTALAPAHGLPGWLVLDANLLGFSSFALALVEGALVVRAWRRRVDAPAVVAG